MKAKPNSRLRPPPPTMPLLNKWLPPKIGSPVEEEEEEEIPSGALRPAVPIGVLMLPPLTGPPLLLLLSPRRMPKSPPSGLTAVPEIVKRKSQTTR